MGKDTKKNFLDSWKNKYRFVVLTEDTFEEKFSVNSSKTGVFVFLCFMLVFLVALLLEKNGYFRRLHRVNFLK